MMPLQIPRSLSLIVLTTTLFIAGCEGIDPLLLPRATQNQVLHITDTVNWKLGVWNVTLMPGSYVGKYESSEGAFFVGPKGCLHMYQPQAGGASWDCIILIPHDKKVEPIVLNQVGSNQPLTPLTAGNTIEFAKNGLANSPSVPPSSSVTGAELASLVPASQGAGTVATGAGTGLGVGIVSAIVAAEQGKFMEFKTQPAKGWLRHVPSKTAP